MICAVDSASEQQPKGQFTHTTPFSCRSHAAKGLNCIFPIWFTQCGRVWFTHAMPRPCHVTTMPFWKWLLKATAQRGMGMAWHVWISIGLLEMACGRPARVRLFPATTRSSTKVIRSIPIRLSVGLAVRIFSATTPTFTKDTTRHGMGTALARYGMCGLALNVQLLLVWGLLI
jgi:hypothetical protein